MRVRHVLSGMRQRIHRPLLSVVIPCRDAAPFVEDAVRSVLNQSLRDLEVVFVDDGSADRSAEIVATLADRDRRVRILRGRGLGPGAARNDGVAAARGRYLAFVDADDKVLPGAYDTMVRRLEAGASDFVIGGYRRHGASGSHRPKVVARVHAQDLFGTTVAEFPEILDEPVLWNRVFRRDFWTAKVVAIPEDVNYEDQEPCLRAALSARTFDVLAEDVYSWRLPDGRTSRSQTKLRMSDLEDRVTVISRMRTLVSDAPGQVRGRAVANWLGRDLVMYALNVPSTGPEYEELLRSCARDLADMVTDDAWASMPFQERLIAWELLHGSSEDLEEVLGSRLEDTTSVPIHVGPENVLMATPPVLARIPEIPEAVRRVSPVDLRVECATSRVAWLGASTCKVIGSAHIAGVDPEKLDGPPVVEIIDDQGRRVSAQGVIWGLDSDADLWANDPWRSYSRTGFVATVPLQDSGSQRIRVTLSVAGQRASSFLPMPATTHFFRVGPLAPDGPRFVFRPAGDSTLEFHPCARSPYRLIRSEGGGDSIDLVIAADEVGLLDGAPPVALSAPGRRIALEVSVQRGLLHAHAQFEPFDAGHQYAGEKRFRLVVGGDDDVPVMWDKDAHLARFTSVRAVPAQDGFAAVEHRARRVTVDSIRVDGSRASVSGRVSPLGWTPLIHLASSNRSWHLPSEDAPDGHFCASIDLADGELRSGGYFLRWALPGDEGCAGWCRTGHDLRSGEQYMEGSVRSVRATPHPGGTLGVTIGPPLAADERSRRARQMLIDSTPPAIRPGILFESFSGKSSADNPGAICADLLAHGVDVPMWWSVVDGTVPVPEGTEAVVLGTRRWFDVARSAKVLVTNNNFPQWFHKQEGQYFLQTWHGTPIKKLLFDAPRATIPLTYRRLMKRQVAQWDLLLAQSKDAEKNLRSSTGYTGEVLIGEQPRNVGLLGGEARAREARKILGIDEDEKVILYAPTWREDLRNGGDTSLLLDPVALAHNVGATVLVRYHHMNALSAHGPGVIDVSHYASIEDLMLVADVLISDYSSIMFDFAMTGGQCIAYMADRPQYEGQERGFYSPMVSTHEMRVVVDKSELDESILAATLEKPKRNSVNGSTVIRTVDLLREQILRCLGEVHTSSTVKSRMEMAGARSQQLVAGSRCQTE